MTSLTMSSVRPFFPCAMSAAQTLVAMQVYWVRCRSPGTFARAVFEILMPLVGSMQTLVNHKLLGKGLGCDLHPLDRSLLHHPDHQSTLLWIQRFNISHSLHELLAELREP